MLYCLLGHLTEIVRRLIIVHESQVHEALLQPLNDFMAHPNPQVLRGRLRVRQVDVVQSRQHLSVQTQLGNGLRYGLYDIDLRGRGIPHL